MDSETKNIQLRLENVEEKIPSAPEDDGVYYLQVEVDSEGNVEYKWITQTSVIEIVKAALNI